MRNVIYSMGVSLDGYAADPDGDTNWGEPDPELFQAIIEETRGLSTYVLGRRLYETMLYWETATPADDAQRTWADIWNALPKLVFSTTLSSVRGSARLATGTLAEEIGALDGEVAIGGPTLAAAAAELDLIDEFRPRVSPVLLGAGLPFFPRTERRVDLELLESRTFPSRTVTHRYRVVR